MNNFKITATNPISLIPIDGTPQRSKSGSEETTLDIESALSSAPGAQLLVYDGDNSDSTTETDEFTQIVDDGKANIVSYSWGLDENEYSPSQLNAMDSLFLAGAAKGMTFLIASGDEGSYDINYPATDPYVTAVGGTTMSINSSSGQISSEVGWSYSNLTQSGSGGGVSSVFLKPSWQPGTTLANSSYRMIPDVSFNADPNTGYSIYYGGNWDQIGGTSVAAPEWAAIFALVDQSRLNNGLEPIGLANPDLYSLASGSVFHDITSGSNGEYSCFPGYDMVTGLGSVDADKLVNALATLQSTAVNEPVGTPSGLTATPVSATQVNMTWSAVSGANSYKVYRSTSSTGSYTLIGNPTTTSFSDTGLTQNTTYYYKISAVGTSGEGQQSNPVNAVTLQATLQSIAITNPATKLNYNIGDSLDITGLVVTGTNSDGSTEVESITAANVTGFSSTVAATNQVLTITVNGQTITYKVQIVAPVPVGNIPVGTVIFGNGQALDLGYATNNSAHTAEVTQDVVSGGGIYVITFAGQVINNSTGSILTDLSSLPAMTYKDASGNVEHFAAGDGPEVTISDNIVGTVSASTFGSLVTINITNPVILVSATQFQVLVNGATVSAKASLGTATTCYPAQASASTVQVKFFNAAGTQVSTTQNVTLK